LSDGGVSREAVLRFQLDRVEEQIDLYWKQRVHTKWLEKGDRNTQFFHAACSDRRRRNKIGWISDGEGGWVEEEVEKKGFSSNFFMQLFKSSATGDAQQLLHAVPPCVTPMMNEDLMSHFMAEEVKSAPDAIGDLKVME
jgi:hypothetical protein